MEIKYDLHGLILFLQINPRNERSEIISMSILKGKRVAFCNKEPVSTYSSKKKEQVPHCDSVNKRNMELPIKKEKDRGREKPDTQYCCCSTQRAILSARATTLLTAVSSRYSPAVSPAPSPFLPFNMGVRDEGGGD